MDPKRLRNAIILTVILTALLGTGIGFVSAAGEDVPDEFYVGQKMVGDEVTYEVTFGDDTWEESFTWETPREVLTDDGNLVLANILTLQTNGPQALNWHFQEDTEVTAEIAYPLNAFRSIYGQMFSAESTQQQGTLTETGFASLFSHKSYFHVRGSCSIFEVPETIKRDSTIRTRECSVASNHVAALRPIKMDDGLLLLEGEGHFAGERYDDIRVWFGGGIPYPMRIETSDIAHSDGGPKMTPASMTLVSYKAGNVPLLQEAATPTPSFQETLGIRQPWGPSGNFDGFSAKDAYLALQADGFIADEHFVSATVSFAETNNYHETNWTVVLHDGRMLSAEERVETDVLSILTGPTVTVETGSMGMVPDRPPLDQLPAQMPTVQSLLEFYDAYTDLPDERTRGYGFKFTCFAGDCEDVRLSPIGGGTYLGFQSSNPFESQITFLMNQVSRNLLGYVSVWEASGDSYSEVSLTPPVAATPQAAETQTKVSPWIAPSATATAGLGFLGVLAGVLYYFKPALFGMFTRLQKDELLEHPSRAQLMETIESNPGMHLQALLRETDMAGGTLRHHLDILAKNQYVKRVDNGGRACYFPKGKIDHGLMVQQAALGSPSAKAIHTALQGGAMTVGELAEAIGLGRSTTSHHVSRLREQGILTTRKEGRNTLVALQSAAS